MNRWRYIGLGYSGSMKKKPYPAFSVSKRLLSDRQRSFPEDLTRPSHGDERGEVRLYPRFCILTGDPRPLAAANTQSRSSSCNLRYRTKRGCVHQPPFRIYFYRLTVSYLACDDGSNGGWYARSNSSRTRSKYRRILAVGLPVPHGRFYKHLRIHLNGHRYPSSSTDRGRLVEHTAVYPALRQR